MNLPALRTVDAPLPQSYEAAKEALANCTRVDECQDWADKAAALASYARQADDDTLHHYAKRIQARAVRRCGELLKQFDGRGRPAEIKDGDDLILPPTQRQVAEHAGLSERQQKTAVRVANVPEERFTAAVESARPPTVTKLAEMGKKVLTDPKPAGFNEAIHTLGAMRRFTEKCREHDAALIASAVPTYEASEIRACVATLDAWLDRFIVNLKG
jgi:hypothetical protein